jgi:hypothetical protein
MPLLLLLIPTAIFGGALAYNSVTRDTEQVLEQATPNLLAIGALVVAGFAVYAMAQKRGR